MINPCLAANKQWWTEKAQLLRTQMCFLCYFLPFGSRPTKKVTGARFMLSPCEESENMSTFEQSFPMNQNSRKKILSELQIPCEESENMSSFMCVSPRD